MHIHLIAIGERMPDWVKSGYDQYAKRLPRECRLQLVEIPAGKRGKGADIARAILSEGERMLAAIPKDARVIALDMRGKQWDTAQLAQQLKDWLQGGRDVALLTGGPEGLAESCLKRADHLWSLSNLTLPHPLVRIVVAEQLYRAWSLLTGHPYHR
ncbi:MAG: 23S rRNA (pseudouridine(1915)-N(3))-methyltransferase RlmH [Gammaproteobacteria bacterium]